jgi:tetratricopeptide (TPR) repeat protein
LAPDSLESQLGLARYRYQGLRDYDGALSLLSRLAAQYPTNPEVIRMPGLIYRRQGNWPAALASLRQAVTLDRGDASLLRSLTQTLRAARRWDEALTEQRRLVALVPGVVWEGYYLGEIPFLASGSRREMSDYIGELERVQGPNGPEVIEVKKRWAIQRGDFADAVRLDGLQPFSEGDRSTEASRAGQAAMVLLAAGKAEVAKQRIERFLPEVRRRAQELSDDYVLQLTWARMELVLGHGSEAVRLGERTLAVVEKSDLWNAAGIRAQLAGLLAWAGQKERALDELERSLREPGGARVYEARSSAWYLPLRGEPRFEAMLADPKNNAPLF